MSAHGALILLREPVSAAQNLALRNILTGEEVACTVAESNPGVAEVGVHIVHPTSEILARRVSTIRLEFARSGGQKIQYPKRKSRAKPANKK